MNDLTVEWSKADHIAEWRADLAYPNGIDIDEHPSAPRSCLTRLAYPAPCCGVWSIHCQACRKTVVITAAGLSDDPRSVRIGCQGGPQR